MKIFQDLVFVPESSTTGSDTQKALIRFENGYGVSVLTGSGALATIEKPYELAVIKYQDDNDYIVECIDLFDKFKGKGNSIFRIYQIESLDKRLPDEIIKIANQCDSPYDFLKGYFIQNNN
jgi:hypothetical protein